MAGQRAARFSWAVARGPWEGSTNGHSPAEAGPSPWQLAGHLGQSAQEAPAQAPVMDTSPSHERDEDEEDSISITFAGGAGIGRVPSSQALIRRVLDRYR
jgi:hypothetical protein